MSHIGQVILEIQEYIAQGLSSEQIAKILGVSVSWIEEERSREFEQYDDSYY